jgi:hypothetical protein
LNTGVTLKNAWHQSVNYIKKSKNILTNLVSFDWRILAFPALLAEALGPCSSKLVERNIYMYPGSRILELEACGLKLEPLCLGLEACSSLLSRLGA